jgi:mono/diheme cytochrome c family protein
MKWGAGMIIVGTLLLGGCERGMHQMYDQAKYKPLAPSPLFADGNSSRPQVSGTVVYSGGPLAGASSGRQGTIEVPVTSPSLSLAVLQRGRQRFEIYCAPCHGSLGDARGVIALRGFPAPPSLHLERLRNAPDSHYFDVISSGYGAMFPYADRITDADRWAIIAYIRALQLSRHAPASRLDASDRGKLQESAP